MKNLLFRKTAAFLILAACLIAAMSASAAAPSSQGTVLQVALFPFAIDGCMVDGQYYAVPQILCMHLLYTRKGDTELSSVSDVTGLHNILGDSMYTGEMPEEGEGLLIDMSGGTTKVAMYLDALCDVNQTYTDYEETPDMEHADPEAVEALKLLRRMGGTDQVQYEPEDGDPFVRGRWFAQGLGRAYIGYSEAMSVMGDAIENLEFRPFSYTGKDNIPLIYGDVAGIRATIGDDKKSLAFDLLNILTGKEVLTAAFSPGILISILTEVHPSVFSSAG